MEDVVFIGFGGHAKSVADCIIRARRYNIVGYTDVKDCHSKYSYMGTDDLLNEIYISGIRKAILGVGFMGHSQVRDSLVSKAKDIGFDFPIIIDPSATIAEDVVIGEGSFIGKNAVVNANSQVGEFCIINTGSIVEHDNLIGDYTHISVGAALCGNVRVGNHTLIGAGTTVIQGKKVGNHCIVGANSTVLSDVEDNMKTYGIDRQNWGGIN